MSDKPSYEELELSTQELEKKAIERKRTEQLLRQSAVLDAINRIFQETLTCETVEKVARTSLSVAEELTGSEFGFIGEVNQAGRFDTIALSNPGWDAYTMPKSDAVVMIEDMQIRGIWGSVIKDERALIVNDPASHHDSVGPPEGHPTLTSFLGVPLKHGDRTVGMIALANKASGYSTFDQEDVETLSIALMAALNRKRSEEALRESEEKYRTLFEDSRDAIYITTREGKLIDANQSALDLFGYSREEMTSVNALQLYVHPSDASKFQKEIEEKGFVRDYEVKLRKKDGTEMDCLLTTTLRRADGGGILAYQGIIRDITERKEAEAALRESEEKYRNLVERANDGIAIAYDEVLQYVNPRLAQIIGYTVEELTGTPFANYIVPEEVQKVVDRYNRRMAGEDVIPIYETAVRHKDGRRIDVELNTGIIAYKGKPADLVIVKDIIERKRAEQALRESEERFRVLVEESPFGVCLIEKDGHYKYINPKFTEIFGYTLEDIPTGQAWFMKAYPDQKYRKQVISTWISDLKESKGGEPRPRTFNIIRKDGSERVIHFRPATMKSGNQFVICEDVTELKRAEEALKESEQRYRTLVESSTDAILMMDSDRNIVTCNQAFLNLFGYEKGEIEGKSIRVIHQSDESFHSFGQIIYPEISRTDSFRTEWEFMHKDGTIFPVETITSA